MSEVWKSWWWENGYSYDNQYPLTWNELPNRIRLSNGFTKTKKETFTQEELIDAGYKIVKYDTTGFNEETHECIWNGTDWIIRQHYFPNEEEMKLLTANYGND